MLFDRISLVEAYDALRVAEANEGIISQILFNKTAYYGTKTVVRFDSVRQLRQHIEQNFAYQQFDPNCECATCNDSIWQLLSFTVQLPDMRYVSFVNNLRGQFESAEGALLNKTTKDRLALVFRKNSRLAVVKKNATCFGYIENQGKYVSPCDYITVIKNDYHDELIALYLKTKGIYGLARTEIYVDKCRDVSREKPAVWDTTTVDPCLDLAATHEIVDAQSIWEATTTLATTTEATTTLATTEATTTLATTLATTTEATTTEATTTEATTTEATTTEATTTEATTTEATTTEATTTEATTTEATTTEATTTEDPWANYFTWYITEPVPRTTNDSWQQMCNLPISKELMIEGAGNPLDSGMANIANKVFRNPDGTLYQLPGDNNVAPNGYWVVAIRGDLYPQYIGAIAGEVDFTVPFSMTAYAGQMRLWTGNDTSGNVGAQQISGSAGAWDGVELCPEPTTTEATTTEATTTEATTTEATTTVATIDCIDPVDITVYWEPTSLTAIKYGTSTLSGQDGNIWVGQSTTYPNPMPQAPDIYPTTDGCMTEGAIYRLTFSNDQGDVITGDWIYQRIGFSGGSTPGGANTIDSGVSQGYFYSGENPFECPLNAPGGSNPLTDILGFNISLTDANGVDRQDELETVVNKIKTHIYNNNSNYDGNSWQLHVECLGMPYPTTTEATTTEATTTEATTTEATTTEATTTEATTTEATTTEATTTEATTTEATTTEATTTEATTTEATTTEATTTEATTTEATTTEATTTEATTTEATTTEATTTEATTTEATTTEATTTEATTTEATTTEATTTEATTTEATTTEATTTEATTTEATTTEATTTEATTTEATTTEATTTEATTTEATTTEATTTEATTTAAPWTPLSLGPVAWIDAADTSSYTRSGTSLQSVTDKAGTYSTITVGGNPVTNSSTQNGLNVFDFDGSDFLQSGGTNSQTYRPQVSSGNHFALGVFRYEGTNSTQDSVWSYETNQSPKRDYAISSGNGSNSWPGELDMDGLSSSSNRISTTIGNLQVWNLKSLVRNQYHIVACWFNKTGNQIGVRVDGQNAFTPVNDYDNSIQTNQQLRLMRNRASQELDGKMGEFVAFASMPGTSGTDMSHLEKAEGYLAHKWGLTGSLPSNHPYKNTPPTA